MAPQTIKDLQELKRRLDRAETVEVDKEGGLRTPQPEDGKDEKTREKTGTTVKPSRWF